MRPSVTLNILFLILTAGAQAALLTLRTPQLTVTAHDGQTRTETLSLTDPIAPVTLGKDDALKITFQVVDKDTGAGIQPHQTFLRFYDTTSGEEGIQPVRITAGGKANFEMNMAKPPTSLPPSTNSAPLQVTLLLGSSRHVPLSLHLFDLYIPPSLPAPIHPEEVLFHPQPEIHHTFRPEQKQPPKFISFIFSVLVLAPWIALVGMWANVWPGLPHLFSPSILPFVLLLGAFESLLTWYWIDLRLGQVLLYGAILGTFTFLAGKRALSKIGGLRVCPK